MNSQVFPWNLRNFAASRAWSPHLFTKGIEAFGVEMRSWINRNSNAHDNANDHNACILYIYVCVWTYIYAYEYIYIYISLSIAFSKSSAKQYIYIFIHIYIYIYMFTHTHIYIWILFWLVLMYSADTTTPGKERNKHNKLSNSKNWVHGNSLLFTPPPQILNLIPTQKGPKMNKSNLKPRCVEIWYEKWNNFLVLWLAILQMIQIHMENHSCCHLLAQIPPDPCENFGTQDIVQEDREVLSSRPDGDDAEEPNHPCSLVFKHPRNHSLDMFRWFTLIWDHRIWGCHMNGGWD